MTEVPVKTLLAVPREEFMGWLGPNDRKNVGRVASNLKSQARREGITLHLVAVGGIVNHRRAPENDIDLLVYSPPLAVESPYSLTAGQMFTPFENFITRALSGTEGELSVIKPFVDRDERWKDTVGAIKFQPPVEDHPIELIPITREELKGGLEDYLNSRTDPYSVIF